MAEKTKVEEQQEHQKYIERVAAMEEVAWDLYDNLKPQTQQISLKDQVRNKAEKIVRSPLRKMLFAIHRPLIRLERNIWEPLLAWANNQALLSLLGLIGNAGIILAVFTYVGTEKQRRDAEVLNAWQTITSAYGQSGSGGRIQALEFLNASPGANWRRKFPWVCAPNSFCTWEAERLDGINLGAVPLDDLPPSDQILAPKDEQSSENTASVYLQGIQLPRASLWEANLEGAILREANLEGAILWGANLKGADLEGSNLEETDLREANLEGAILWGANLKGADLGPTNLEEALLGDANLEGAYLMSANLKRADLSGANLQEADLLTANLEGAVLVGANLKRANLVYTNLDEAILGDTNLDEAVLQGTNLEGASSLTNEQLTSAKLCLTTLPDGIALDPNRDCEELGIDPE
ncbi:pentapeptide repeat-containing protein [Nodosilinea sp. LEGE 07088]|uniref:pentapeptide repeat-containing protein n=1 Tax=Nodosilinea sp. LEGE 07088 TaxID=2777968 RepID=UPI00187E4016|nr:pentapeptide repeat-containing protein [Nodosilinea sp. LEGE 07088]MBE9139800.1 pentapeptide repeat-containing protein [Nodosilinea sp. LEGE 07088]